MKIVVPYSGRKSYALAGATATLRFHTADDLFRQQTISSITT